MYFFYKQVDLFEAIISFNIGGSLEEELIRPAPFPNSVVRIENILI